MTTDTLDEHDAPPPPPPACAPCRWSWKALRCVKPCRWSWRTYSCRPPAGVEQCEASDDMLTVAAVTLTMLLLFLIPLLLMKRRTTKPNHGRSVGAASSSASRTSTASRSSATRAAPNSPVRSPVRSPVGAPIKSPVQASANGTPSSRWGLPVSPAEAFLTSLVEAHPPQSELLGPEELKCLPGCDHRWVKSDWLQSTVDRPVAGGLPKTWKTTARAALDQHRADEAPILWACRYCGKQVQLRSKLHPSDANARLERPSPAMMARMLTALPSPRAQVASPPGSSSSKPGAPSSGSGRAVKRTPSAGSLSKTPTKGKLVL